MWAYPACLVPLSFRLHAELAARHDGPARWGYRRVGCGSFSATVTSESLAQLRRASASAASASEADAAGKSDPEQPVPSSRLGNGPGSGGPDDGSADQKAWEKLPKQDDDAKAKLQPHPSGLPADLDWVDAALVDEYHEMGGPGKSDTAQVHPFHFTTAIAALAQEKGVAVRLRAQATKLHYAPDGAAPGGGERIASVEYVDRDSGEAHTLTDVTDVVVAAGPWTGRLLPKTRVEGLRAHSVVWDANVSPYAVFTDVALPPDYVPDHRARMGQKRKHRGRVDPEIYARPGNEVYACGKFHPFFHFDTQLRTVLSRQQTDVPTGEPDKTIPLPDTADQVQFDRAQCDDLIAYVATVSPALATAPVRTRQACYLPRHMRFG